MIQRKIVISSFFVVYVFALVIKISMIDRKSHIFVKNNIMELGIICRRKYGRYRLLQVVRKTNQ